MSNNSKLTPDDHVAFLICCIRNTDSGRPDFAKVANDMNLVSKGAAAKRYERLIKANTKGDEKNGDTSQSTPPSKGKRSAKANGDNPSTPTPKRRKTNKAKFEEEEEEEVDDAVDSVEEPAIKAETRDRFDEDGGF